MDEGSGFFLNCTLGWTDSLVDTPATLDYTSAMKISYSEFKRFKATRRTTPALRLGQAWFNYFNLHKHTPADFDERVLLDRIYNERDAEAQSLILTHFTDMDN